MCLLILLVFVGWISTAVPAEQRNVPMLDGQIVGGSSVAIENYPYQASLRYYGTHVCAASIISSNWAVTAAHCVEGLWTSGFQLRAGSKYRNSGGSLHSVVSIISHSSYDSKTLDYDIAVLHVRKSFKIGTDGVDAIALPLAGSTPNTGVASFVSGWRVLNSATGKLSAQLQVVQVPIISKQDCSTLYGNNSITDRMLCAGYTTGDVDACQGDSGGPLVTDGVLVGIVSWGHGCASSGYPGVYADVGVLTSWIKEKTEV